MYLCMYVYDIQIYSLIYMHILVYMYFHVYTYNLLELGTYSDWGLSSVLVINKHLSHHITSSSLAGVAKCLSVLVWTCVCVHASRVYVCAYVCIYECMYVRMYVLYHAFVFILIYTTSQWLFFHNATKVQLHGGKNPIVLYQEMKLQFELHVSIEPAAASLHRFNWSGPPPGTRNFRKEHLVHVQ